MTSRSALAVGLVCLAFTAVVVGALQMIQRDRAVLVDQFAHDRLRQVEEAARGVEDELEDVGEDLRFAARLLLDGGPDQLGVHERELGALLAVVREYKAVEVRDADGGVVLRVVDPAGVDVDVGVFETFLSSTARAALRRPQGEIETSPPIEVDTGWFRVFATPIGTGGVIALLVDTQPYFGNLRIVATEPGLRVILLGAHGKPTAASDPELAGVVRGIEERRRELPVFALLVDRMRGGQRGTLRISEAEADALGLGAADAIAAYTPIRVKGGNHWSAATVSSTTALRAHERAIVVRLGLAAGAIAVGILAFGFYVVVASRRDAALRERLRHADELAHLHEKTQKILDNIPTGVMALSEDGRIGAVNRALAERIPAGLVGADLALAFPEAPPAVVGRIRSLVDGARSTGRVQSVHGEPLALFGEEGQYSLHAVPLEARLPEVRVLLVVEDLSQVRALESQLLRAEKLATIGILAAGIAHEIGTPLGVVRGRAEYILGKLGPDHPQAPGIHVIVEQIDRVSRTIRQLLDFSRVRPAAVRPTDAAQVVRNVAELLRYEAERRKVAVEVELDELPAVAADPDQLQQVLVNLVLNACDACVGHGGRVVIRGRAEPSADPSGWDRVRLTVEDDGCGIPPEHLNQVFDPFFTTKKRGQGTGLGLTMAAQIVRNHGGRIEIESRRGAGTVVTLLWPTAPAATEERHAVPV